MIACPHCDRHFPHAEGEWVVDCPFCKTTFDLDVIKARRRTKIAIGIGVGVVVVAAVYFVVAEEPVEPKFQPAYGAPVPENITFD